MRIRISFLVSSILNKAYHILKQNFSVRSGIFDDTSDNLSSFSASSFLLMFSVWLSVKTMIIDLKTKVKKIVRGKDKMVTAVNDVYSSAVIRWSFCFWFLVLVIKATQTNKSKFGALGIICEYFSITSCKT